MIGIILHHLIIHSNIISMNNSDFLLQFVVILLSSFGKIGLHIFAILTGYFSYKKSTSIKKIFKIAFQIWFLTMVINIFILIFKGNILTYTDIFPVFMRICGYGTAYLMVALLSKYTNKFAEKLNKISLYSITIFLLIIFYSFLIKSELNTFYMLYTDYLIGIILFRYTKNIKINNNYAIPIYIFIYIVLILFSTFNIEIYLLFFSENIFTILFSIFAILIFKEIKFKNDFINMFASGTLSVLIIHDNPHIREIFISKFNLFQNVEFILFKILITFVISIFIYLICFAIHMYIYKPIEKIIFKDRTFIGEDKHRQS